MFFSLSFRFSNYLSNLVNLLDFEANTIKESLLKLRLFKEGYVPEHDKFSKNSF